MHRYTQIVIIKLFTLALILLFLTPPYQRLIWDYKKADSKNICKAIYFHEKDINSQVVAFSEIMLNVFRNYVPNKYVTLDDKDPVWMSETTKSKTTAKNVLYKKYIQIGKFENDFVCLENFIIKLSELIPSTKALYPENLTKQLNNLLLQAKT